MPLLCHGDATVHYQSEGEGPPMILIHGLGANLAFWYPQIVAALCGFQVLTYDLRGHGRSGMNPSGYAPGDLAKELLGLMDFLGIDRAHLAGHSFGGAVALRFASLFPQRVRSLTLADAIVGSIQRIPGRGEGEWWKGWRARIEECGGVVAEDALRVSYGLTEEFARQGETAPTMGKRAEARWRDLLAKTSALDDFAKVDGLAEAEIGRLNVPVLTIYGEHSYFVPTSERLSQLLPDCRRILLDGAGHFYPLTRSLEFSQHLRSFAECHN